MLRRMLVKEWKEKFGLMIFALAGLLLFFVAASVYSKEPETLDILVSTILFIFLPAFSLLLGASGFASEFQDGAWAYLFSRPVRKWRIWLAKYVSLLTVLYAVVLLFDLLIRFHPALKTANKNFSFSLLGDLSHGQFVYLLPLLFFTTAFSLSIVSDKPFHVAFLAALIWIALQMALTRGIAPLLYRSPLYSTAYAIPIVFVILPLSFALASFITLDRADFSQPRSRAWIFTKSAAILFLAFIILLSFFTFGVWKLRGERYFYSIQARADAFYFTTNKGFYKFDLADGRTEKIAHYLSVWGISIGGDKAAFVIHPVGGKQRGLAALRIMNTDGTEEKSLAETWDKESPLYGSYLYRIQVAPQGDRVAFIGSNRPASTNERLWVINSDGTGLKGHDLRTANIEYCLSIWFENSGLSVFLFCSTKIKPGGGGGRAGGMLLRVNLESGEIETIVDMIRKPLITAASPSAGMTSESGRISFLQYNESLSKEILTVLDLETLETRQVCPEETVTGFRWNDSGDKLAFLTQTSKVGIYSAPELKLVKLGELKGYDLRWPSHALGWTRDGRIIMRKTEGEISYLCVLDTDLREQKAIRIPFVPHYPAIFWRGGKYAIVQDDNQQRLWGVDLETDKWLRVY